MLRPPKGRIGDCPATDAAPSEAAKDAGPEDQGVSPTPRCQVSKLAGNTSVAASGCGKTDWPDRLAPSIREFTDAPRPRHRQQQGPVPLMP
jgi:hypothetical protein